jgi:hypothetical protein
LGSPDPCFGDGRSALAGPTSSTCWKISAPDRSIGLRLRRRLGAFNLHWAHHRCRARYRSPASQVRHTHTDTSHDKRSDSRLIFLPNPTFASARPIIRLWAVLEERAEPPPLPRPWALLRLGSSRIRLQSPVQPNGRVHGLPAISAFWPPLQTAICQSFVDL